MKRHINYTLTIFFLFAITSPLYATISTKINGSVEQLTEKSNEAPISILQKKLNLMWQSTSRLGITLFKPNYILPAYYTASPDQDVYEGDTPNNQKVQSTELKAQLSFMVPLWKRIDNKNISLDVAYSQLMYWQFYAKSQYFRETDYEPEIFFTFNTFKNTLIRTGIVHQSNGRGGNMERSWNRLYADFTYGWNNWFFSIKPWLLIFKADSSDLHNKNINHYLGNGRLIISYRHGRNEISFSSRNNIQSGFKRGAEELDYSFHVAGHFYIYAQALSGYGQSLIEYNHYTNAVGIGIALNDWLSY